MNTAAHFACRFLGGLFDSRVGPVVEAYDAEACDAQPCNYTRPASAAGSAAASAAGSAAQPDARARAAEIRAQLAQLCAGSSAEAPAVRKEDVLASYEAAKSLLADLWSVIQEDALDAPSWAGHALTRAVARGAPAQ